MPSHESHIPPPLLTSPDEPVERTVHLGAFRPTPHATPGVEAGAVITVDRPGPWLQLYSPKGYEWTRVRLPIENLPPELEGFRLLQITDMHMRKAWFDAYDELLNRIARENLDAILLTGDFVDNKKDHRPAIPTVERFVNGLRSRLGTFAIVGNHDGDLFMPKVARLNVTMVDSRLIKLKSHGATIELIGLPSVDRADLDARLLRSFPPREPGAVRIIMAHFPDHLRKVGGLGADLMVAGHTHGGQICLPGRRMIATHDSLPRRLCAGVHKVGKMWFVVNRGLGFSTFQIRLFCPAEVVEIVLARQAEMQDAGRAEMQNDE